jgi:hypothetical protein
MNVLKSTLSSALVLAGTVLVCASAQAAPACASVSQIERRIVERADAAGDDDVAPLRNFVGRTSITTHVNMVDVRLHLDNWRTAVACQRQVAAAEQARVSGTTVAVAQR